MLIDFHLLNEALMAPECEQVRREFREKVSPKDALSLTSGCRAEDWRSLQIESSYKDRLHPTTVARLDADLYSKAPLMLPIEFEGLNQSNLGLRQLLLTLRSCVTPYNDSWRTSQIAAEAGFTKLIAHFPEADVIARSLDLLEEFRRCMPLQDPLWNVLTLELLLLRLHPFKDGNGRTARAVAAFELWRLGVSRPMILPTRRVLDANRATQLHLLVRLTADLDIHERMRTLSQYLIFRASLWIRAHEDALSSN